MTINMDTQMVQLLDYMTQRMAQETAAKVLTELEARGVIPATQEEHDGH
jgi:hypothetical protein